jgi:hypothetical protein
MVAQTAYKHVATAPQKILNRLAPFSNLLAISISYELRLPASQSGVGSC